MIKERKYQMTERDVQELFAKILDDLADELRQAERQLWTGNQQTPASDAAGWALQIMIERINVVRTRNYGERKN